MIEVEVASVCARIGGIAWLYIEMDMHGASIFSNELKCICITKVSTINKYYYFLPCMHLLVLSSRRGYIVLVASNPFSYLEKVSFQRYFHVDRRGVDAMHAPYIIEMCRR